MYCQHIVIQVLPFDIILITSTHTLSVLQDSNLTMNSTKDCLSGCCLVYVHPIAHRIHVWYVYHTFTIHLPDKLTKCRYLLPWNKDSTWKYGVPKRKGTIFQPSIFRCKLAVSFREGIPYMDPMERNLRSLETKSPWAPGVHHRMPGNLKKKGGSIGYTPFYQENHLQEYLLKGIYGIC